MFKQKNFDSIHPTIMIHTDRDMDLLEVTDEGGDIQLTTECFTNDARVSVLLDQKDAIELARILLDWATGQRMR